MAIVVFGGVVSGARGTIAGVTYSANKAGPYAKGWSRGANVRSALQTSGRGVHSVLAGSWRALSAGERTAWDVWAADPEQELTNALGEAYYISGFLWSIKIGRWLDTCGRAATTSPPTSPAQPAPTILTLRVSGGATTSRITYALNEFAPVCDCVIEMAIGQSVGGIAMPVPPIVLGGWQVPGGTSLDISAEVLARFGAPQVGQRAFALVRRQTLEGYRSAPTAIAVDVVA